MRRICLFAGLALLVLIWAGPLLHAWRESFAAHMLAHMGVVALATPLIAIGLSDRLARHGRKWLGLPIIASLLELAVVWAWHAPALRQWAQTSTLAIVIEQVSFLAAGLFLWLVCLGAANAPREAMAGAFGLLLTSIHMTLLGALLALSPRPLYGLDTVTCFGLTLAPAQDQALGGALMLAIGAAVYLAGGVALLGRAVRFHGQGAG